MRYKLDSNGFIKYVLFGCYTGGCAEYTGAVPSGYSDLADWANNACINAYYLDENGNLTLDSERQNLLQTKYEKEAIDYAPVLHKDLYATNEIIDAQYKKNTVTGTLNFINNARSLTPMIKLTGLSQGKINIFAQSKNMLPLTAITETKGGISFTVGDGIAISGTAAEDVVYCLLDSDRPAFGLLKGQNYYLDLGGLECELIYEDETIEQVYEGASGFISLSENKTVNKVLIKIPAGTTVNKTIYPALSHGLALADYEEARSKTYSIDLSEYEISDTDYVLIGEGLAVLYSRNTHVVGDGSMGLLNGYNMVYTDKGNTLEINYTTNEFLVDDMAFLQGTSTTSGRFVINEDGSIQATGGTFNGKVVCTELTVASGAAVSGLDTGITAAQATQITKDTIETATLTAKNLSLEGGSVNIAASSSNDSRINVSYNYDFAEIAPGMIQVGNRLYGYYAQLDSGGLTASYVDVDKWICDGVSYTPDSFMKPGDSLGTVYCDNVGTSYLYPSIVHCNNVAVHTSTTLSNNNAGFNSTYGYIQEYSGSSEKFKHDIHSMPEELKAKMRGLYDVEVKCWKYNEDYLAEEDELFGVETFGLIAEDLNEVLPEAITHKADGSISNYRDRNLLNAMLYLIQEQKKEIDQLKADVKTLKGEEK